jgi:Cu-Zn family superoxide dismutase
MISTVQKSCVLASLVLMMSACSSINLDNNASKIQTQPTTTDQKQLIQVYQVDAKGVGASIGTVTFKQTAKGLLITLHFGNFPQVNMVFISMKTAHVKQH